MSNDDRGALIGCGVSIVVFVLIVQLMGFFVEAGYDSDVAQIESLRADAAHVDPQQGEDVIGQVTQWNQTIASNQFWNGIPIAGFFVSDRWVGVKRIEVPQ